MAEQNHTFTDGEGNVVSGTGTPLPCPFCGSTNIMIWHQIKAGNGDVDVYVANCDTMTGCAIGPLGETPQEAASRWNARAG